MLRSTMRKFTVLAIATTLQCAAEHEPWASRSDGAKKLTSNHAGDVRIGFEESEPPSVSVRMDGRLPHPVRNRHIKEATTIKVLLRTHCTQESLSNEIEVSDCWASLGELARRGLPEETWLHTNTEAMEPLVHFTVRAIGLGKMDASGLARVSYGAAQSGMGESLGKLFVALATAIERHAREFNAKNLADTAWAFATAGRSDALLFAALAKAAIRIVDEFTVRDMANTAWAFAKAVRLDSLLFSALARTAEQRVADFTAQELAKMVWAFATVGVSDGPLFKAMSKAAERLCDEFATQDLAMTAWAFAKAGRSEKTLFAALARAAEQRAIQFTPEELSDVAWAFAKAGWSDASLFAALARVVEQHVNDFQAKELAITTTAFAKVGWSEVPLLVVLAKAAQRRAGEFSSQELANIAWAFASTGWSDPALFAALAKAAERLVGELNAQELASVLWAFGRMGHLDAPLLPALARVAELVYSSLFGWIYFFCYGCMFLWAHATAFLKWIFVLITVPVMFYIDIANWLRRKANLCLRTPVYSSLWIASVFISWLIVLATQMPFWYWLFSKHPIIIAEFYVMVLITAKSLILKLVLSKSFRASLLSRRCGQAVHILLQPAGQRREETLPFLATAALTAAAHVTTRWDSMLEVHPQAPYIVMVISVSERLLLWLYHRKMMFASWELLQRPVHMTAAMEDCPLHDTCAICLENLCTSVTDVANAPLLVQCRFGPHFSACRAQTEVLGKDLTRRRRRAASPGLSAARCQVDSSGNWECGHLAKLRCGHRFHLTCITQAAESFTQCPTCRASLDTGEPEKQVKDLVMHEEVCVAGIGIIVMLFLLKLYSIFIAL